MSKCANCTKTENLKECAKCRSEHYCSRDCQKAHWKAHKKVCGRGSDTNSATPGTNSATPGTNSRSSKVLDVTIDKPYHKLDAGTWLHDRSENDVYKLLIDTCRVRLDDNYNLEQKNTKDSVFAGEPHTGLLPPWWSAEKAKECIALGMDKPDDWYSLRFGPEKGDIIKHYGDDKMPMQMEMLGEQVYGSGPGGQSRDILRKAMMKVEGNAGEHLFLADLSVELGMM
ncbi:putative MYND domain protein [Delphinella strobiligena]|nr:putative MYND domain protein [Delphinella strobiligena]